MSGKASILFFILISWCVAVWAESIPVVEVDAFTELIQADGNFAYCHAREDAQCTESAYTLLTSDVLSQGFTKGEVTLYTRLVNTSDISRKLKLELGNPSLNQVRVLVTSGEDTVKTVLLGDIFPFYDRGYFHRNFILPFTIHPQQELQLQITILPQRAAVFLPLRIVEEKRFLKASVLEFLLMGGLAGMYSIYIVFILGLFLLWRNKLFLYYALIDFFVLVYCLYDTGYGFQFFWPETPAFQRFVIPVIAFCYLMAIVSFTREFFSTKIKYPALDKIMIGFQGTTVLAFLAVVILFNFLGVPLAVPLWILTALFLFFGLIAAALGTVTFLQSGRREGFWYVFLFSMYLLLFALILNQKGYLPWFVVQPDSAVYYHLPLFTSTPHYIFMLVVVEMITISAVIAFRFQDVLKEYNVTQRRIEAVNRNSIKAFIKGQEEERLALAERLERKIGVGLNSIEHDLNVFVHTDPGQVKASESLEQLHDVRQDLHRIASDYVVDWSRVDVVELIDRVFDELKAVLPHVRVEVDTDPVLHDLAVGDLLRLNLYRILQEACNNIIKHAEATEVQARFEVVDAELEVSIDDDGVGFDLEAIRQNSGIGLRNMETRCKALNGSMEISATPGIGTRIQLSIPVGKNHRVE